MSNAILLKAGRWMYATAILAIGIIHLITSNFPTGLLPVTSALPGRQVLVYVTGAILVIAGLLLLSKKLSHYAVLLAGVVWLIFLLALHIPLLLPQLHDGGEWTATFEVVGLLSGACLVAGSDGNSKLIIVGRWLFLSALVVFTVLHYVYLQYIVTLIPGWLPGHLFWSWLVLIAFFAASISLLINKKVRLTGLLLGLMFLLWVLMLHLPRVIGKLHSETEWSSLFVCLAMGGVSLLIAALAKD